MLKRILVGLAAVLVLLVGVAYVLPRRVHVERQTTILAPQANVFAVVNGHKSFNAWSPWAALDPNARYAHEGPEFGVGAKLSWSGDPKKVGSGSQTIVESRPYEAVKSTLDFGPRGTAATQFTLSPDGGGTRIVWGIDVDLGMNPAGRYFGLMFDRMMGPDFERGLASLKAFVEGLPGTDIAGLDVAVVETQPVRVAYVEATSARDQREIAAAIGGAYAEIGKFMKSHGLAQAGPPITIDTKWDDTGYAFDAAVPVDKAPDREVPADSHVRIKETYAGRALKVVHKGPYREMPATYEKLHAWAATHGFERAGPPWDEYVSDPGSTAEADLITNLVLPVK